MNSAFPEQNCAVYLSKVCSMCELCDKPKSFFFFFFLVFCLFRAIPATYAGAQARGLIRASAAGLRHSHSNSGSEPCL